MVGVGYNFMCESWLSVLKRNLGGKIKIMKGLL